MTEIKLPTLVPTTTRLCSECKVMKPDTDFYNTRSVRCKECAREKNREDYYLMHDPQSGRLLACKECGQYKKSDAFGLTNTGRLKGKCIECYSLPKINYNDPRTQEWMTSIRTFKANYSDADFRLLRKLFIDLNKWIN